MTNGVFLVTLDFPGPASADEPPSVVLDEDWTHLQVQQAPFELILLLASGRVPSDVMLSVKREGCRCRRTLTEVGKRGFEVGGVAYL